MRGPVHLELASYPGHSHSGYPMNVTVTEFYPRLGITPCLGDGRLPIGQEVWMFLTYCEPILGALLKLKEAPAKDLSRERPLVSEAESKGRRHFQ